MAFEITTIAARDTATTIDLKDAAGNALHDADGNRLSVTIHGPGTKAFHKASLARSQRALNRLSKKGTMKLNAEEQEQESSQFLADITVSFDHWTYHGSSTDFVGAYADPALGFIRRQLDEALEDWANFTKA